jgi:hypothetical protein
VIRSGQERNGRADHHVVREPLYKLLDGSQQRWWPNDDYHRSGYNGRWGVRGQTDPMLAVGYSVS